VTHDRKLINSMKYKMTKEILKKIIFLPYYFLSQIFFLLEKIYNFILPKSFSGLTRQFFISKLSSDYKTVNYESDSGTVSFKLYTPNATCSMRFHTFATKEPETLDWIDEFGKDGIFFDIGANIGIYSLYFAKKYNANVFSFEPSVFNLKQLAKNISINSLNELISIIPNPLSNKTHFADFVNTSDDEGGALSAFGVNYGFDGLPIKANIKYSTLGFTLDKLLDIGVIKNYPSLIKIDVDGIEHLILKGATEILKSRKCKSVLIEVNSSFSEQYKAVHKIMNECGFSLRSSDVSPIASNQFANTHNQIWVKS